MNQEEKVKSIVASFMYESFQECVDLIRKAGISEHEYNRADIAELYEAYNEHQVQEENRAMEKSHRVE